jgi:AraC-like DNA-binding protein
MDINHKNFSVKSLPQRPALGLQLLCQTLDELGLDASHACAATGLERQFIDTPGQLIRKDQEAAFINAVLSSCERADLAFRVGLRYHYGVFGVWGLAVATSENLLQALQVAQEFIELTHSFAGLSLSVERQLAKIALQQDYPDGPAQKFIVERDLMITLIIASEAAGRRLPVRSIHIALAKPAHSALLARMLDCEVEWDSDHTAAYIELAELKKPLPQANALTWSACVRQCRELVAMQSGTRSLQSRVRDSIVQSHFKGINAVCEQMAVSERSLRRRLQLEKTSFRALQQSVRRDLAEQYLADHSLSLDAIAERLGYSETANFCHAFNGWFGISPGQRRRQLQSAQSELL